MIILLILILIKTKTINVITFKNLILINVAFEISHNILNIQNSTNYIKNIMIKYV